MRYFFLLAFCFFLVTCSENENSIPNVYLNLEIDLNSPEHIQLKSLGGNTIITDHGYKGVIVYRFSNSEYKAYDRSCSFQPNLNCSKIDSISSALAFCGCCSSVFLLDQDGQVANGPAILQLKSYSTLLQENLLFISN